MPFDGEGEGEGGGWGVSAVSPRVEQVLISSGELTKESFYLVSLSVWFPFGVRINPEPTLLVLFRSTILIFSFSWELKWPLEKLKTMLMQNFGVTNKEHYDMSRYFLGLSVVVNKWGLSPETSLNALLIYRYLCINPKCFKIQQLNRSKYFNTPLYFIVFLLLFKNNDKKKNKKLGCYKKAKFSGDIKNSRNFFHTVVVFLCDLA